MRVRNSRIRYKVFNQKSDDIYMFTANSTIKVGRELTMGAGCAKVVRDTYKGIDLDFGIKIEHHDVFGVTFREWGNQWIGAFQTKIDWKEETPIEVLETSIRHLKFFADNRPKKIFHLPCPAINHGGMSRKDVIPMLEVLPDNVIVYVDK